jgi:hypothetical protein
VMKAKKKSKLTSASSRQIDEQLHRVSFREIKVLCAVLQNLSAARIDLVRARFKQDGLHFSEVVDFLGQLGILELSRGQIRQRENFGKSDDEIKSGLVQRLFARSTPYQLHVNEFIGHFQSVDGNFEIVMNSEKRRRFGGIRNLLLDLEFLEQDADKPRYWVSPQYLTIFLETKCKSSTSPAELQEILRAREKLGREAELEVLEFESARLRNHPGLAKRIKHVAVEDVGAGYDILSFTESTNSANFSDRLIEVKAVSLTDFKFYWSRNEIETARVHGSNYFLYLLPVTKFGFDVQKLKIIQNPFESICLNDKNWFRQNELISFWAK